MVGEAVPFSSFNTTPGVVDTGTTTTTATTSRSSGGAGAGTGGNDGDGADPRPPFYGGLVPRTPMLDVLRQTLKKTRLSRLEQVLASRCGSVQVLLENIQDPHNGATCLRTADAYGLCYVHVVERFMPFGSDPAVEHNASEYVEIRRYPSWQEAVDALRKKDFTLVATTLDPEAVPIADVDFHAMSNVCVLLGNEERGLSPALLEQADVKMYLPMVGMVQSFNISVTCGQVLHHLRLLGRIQPDLDRAELPHIYEKWIVNNASHAKKIIQEQRFDFPML